MGRKDAISDIRQILIRRRDALRRALAGDLSLLGGTLVEQSSADMVDGAMDSVQHDISSRLVEVETRELACIEESLERMKTGAFGICEDCGINISLARLNALPYATRCIRCQVKAEREIPMLAAEPDAEHFEGLLFDEIDLTE